MLKSRTGLNRLVKRLLTEREFMPLFRQDPQGWGRKYRLSEAELTAVLEGDEERLLALGLDPHLCQPELRDTSWLHAALLRMGRAAAVAVLLLAAYTPGLALAAGPRAKARARARDIAVRRAGRSRNWIAHPVRARARAMRAKRALTRSASLRGRAYYRTEMRARRFARARALGVYQEESAVLQALHAVDSNIPAPDGRN